MKILCDHPGGNIIVKGVDNTNDCIKVTLSQDLRGTANWWFYWNFRVIDCPVGRVHFSFQNRKVISPHGVATSTDGIEWTWTESNGFIDHMNFTYDFTGETVRYFSFCIPYQVSDYEQFILKLHDKPINTGILTHSEKGRQVPLLTFGGGARAVILTARHHCCEATGSYALEGFIREVLAKPDEYSNYRFFVIPFVDIDGVEEGDQGKDRIPHDHNRDYGEDSIYAATRAIRELCQHLDVTAAFDFHSPWCWGGGDDFPHLHLGPTIGDDPDLQKHFSDRLHEISKTIPYDDTYISHYGSPYNKEGTPAFKNWFALKKGVPLALTVETPYSGALPRGYSKEDMRAFGACVARAMKITLN